LTASSAGWRGAEAVRPRASPYGKLADIAAFGLSVFIILVYSQVWVSPLLGDKVADEATSSLIRTLYFPAYGASIVLLALRPVDAARALIREPFLVALMGIIAASMLWSAEPDQTQRRLVAVLFTTLGGVVLGSRWRWSTLAELFATSFALLAVASLFVGLFLPDIGRMKVLFPGAWRGLWPEKNGFGALMTFSILFFLPAALFAPKRAGLWLSMAGLAFGLLLLSTSKTSLVSLILGLAALGFVLLARRGGVVAILAVYGGVLGLVGLGAALFLAPDVFLSLLGKDATLTGRTKIWTAVLHAIHRRPWLGYGYGAVWTETDLWGPLNPIVKEAGFKPEHAHNSWLEQWLGMGVIGLTAWVLYYVTTLCQAIWAVFTNRGALIVFPFLMVFTLMTLTESIVLVYNDLSWVLFVAMASRLALPQRATQER
jgi:O-antigen ligase